MPSTVQDYKFHTIVDDGVEIAVTFMVYEGDQTIKGYKRTKMIDIGTRLWPSGTPLDEIRAVLDREFDKQAVDAGRVVVDEQKPV